MSDDGHLLTVDEVLGYLRVELRTVYRLIKAGRLPAVKIGRQWRFKKSDLDAWLEDRPTGSLAAPKPAKLSRDERQSRVLVVDDDPEVRNLLAKSLTLAEYNVDVASDGRGALELLRLSRYDLLIIDVNLPQVDGLSVIREVKRTYPTMPVLIITGQSTESVAIDAANLGVSGYLTKPFRMHQVIAKIEKLLCL